MNTNRSAQVKRKSMLGVGLLAFGIVAAAAFLVAGSFWMVGIAALCCVVAVVLLYQVGRSLP
jgi:1,4-dihydroxy-2-naphthoate octaprenyltransferase